MKYDPASESLYSEAVSTTLKQLPHWVLTDTFPAIYDSESDTAIQMVAKLYGAMQTQINQFNLFVDQISASISEFESGTKEDIEQFKTCMINTMENYIKSIDMKTDDAVAYMKTNIAATTKNLVNEMLASGQITVTTNYNAETENLDFVFA